jgi:hypothetical protein
MIGRRRAADGTPAVEFVASQESPAIADDSSPAQRHNRWYLLLCAVVLMGAALLFGRSGTDDPTAVPPSPSVLRTTATTPPCPGPGSCRLSSRVPVDVAAAVLNEFAGASLGPALTQRLANGELWSRELTARAGPLDVVVRIQRPEAVTALQPDRTHAVSYVRQAEHGYVVQIQVQGPLHEIPQVGRLYRLAADLRLLTLD